MTRVGLGVNCNLKTVKKKTGLGQRTSNLAE